MIPWDWSSVRERSISGRALKYLAPLVTVAPWITVGVLVLMMYFLAGTFTAHEGVLFDLPRADYAEGVTTSLVALVMPVPGEGRGTLVFFDDARFTVGDENSERAFIAQMSSRSAKLGEQSLLMLADRRVPSGELLHLAGLARKGGIHRVLFATKQDATD